MEATRYRSRTVLQSFAENGRVDMVRLLSSAGAMSMRKQPSRMVELRCRLQLREATLISPNCSWTLEPMLMQQM